MLMKNYKNLSKEISAKIAEDKKLNILSPFRAQDQSAVRRIDNPHDYSTIIRNAFVRDVDKILNCPFYSRYADKTQVFSLYKNDDIARRGFHVQLVSRIARTIGSCLGLNLDLIEAIALGHDLGHTPFGHTGEHILNDISREKTGRYFAHNLHSARVVDTLFPLNVTLQTLDGIVSHNGESELIEYSPKGGLTFSLLDEEIEKCHLDISHVKKLIPSTLEGCVVRISDIIAYLGKDRHDAEKNNLSLTPFADYGIGTSNAEIINNLTVNIIENSYGKPYLGVDEQVFDALKKAKKDNYDYIYNNPEVQRSDNVLNEMMHVVYEKLLTALTVGDKNSPIFTHHIEYLDKPYYKRKAPYLETDSNQIVIDYIASMTDDYFISLYHYLFPKGTLSVKYKGYFE